MDSMKDRIRTRREELRLTQKGVGKLVGVSPSAVSQWESGASEPADEKLDLLAEALLVEREWIEFGPGGKPVRSITGRPSSTEIGNDALTNLLYQEINQTGGGIRQQRVATIEVKPIDVIGEVQAGVFKTAVEWPKSLQFEVKVPVETPYNRVHNFGLRVLGPSMDQVFPDGTIVVCAKIQDLGPLFELQSGRYVVVIRRAATEEVEATVKQFIRDENGVAWLWPRSNHPEFQAPTKVEDLATSDDNDEVIVWALVVAQYRMLV
jgi:transcriptional regulator with XRE-family HTH domain